MWVADRDNCALRCINMTTGIVSTVAGGVLADQTLRPVESATRPNIYAAMPAPPQTVHDWIRFPQCVRVDSVGIPIVAENLTKSVKAVDPLTEVVSFVNTAPADLVSGNNP